jgi:hypothetical protein
MFRLLQPELDTNSYFSQILGITIKPSDRKSPLFGRSILTSILIRMSLSPNTHARAHTHTHARTRAHTCTHTDNFPIMYLLPFFLFKASNSAAWMWLMGVPADWFHDVRACPTYGVYSLSKWCMKVFDIHKFFLPLGSQARMG